MTTQPRAVTCRAIEAGDLDSVAAALTSGFPERGRAYWDRALRILAGRSEPPGYPRFGLMLDVDGVCVGVLLQIFSTVQTASGPKVRCNLSSWYVDPAYRGYATLLESRARRWREVIYINTSAAPHTWPILKARGFHRYSDGQLACLPALSLGGFGVRVRAYRPGEAGHAPETAALLDAHADFGLVVLVCEGRGGAPAPFAFLPRDVRPLGRRVVQLAWCQDSDQFARYAGALGRALLRRGYPVVLLDGLGPAPGLVGRFFKDRAPKYYHGSVAPRLNDLAWTEAALFGA